ncbi:hypothetical protein [Bartonella sp. HY406]|uniref:hypothetical protein n=1 Tax=Bartonella sp. HY406 TaxID=2979331 RepID=UPI0021C61DFF|nr:hypothetical protein [Bartonella sp. HY406]UXN02329.1 hypothetical protein N6B01_07420 [Bartonella sp. HY406]
MYQNPDMIRVAAGFGTLDTYALKTYLNSYGIEVMLDNSYFSAASPHYVFATEGINMWVFTSDWPAVKELIATYRLEQEQGASHSSILGKVVLTVLWVVLMVLCSTPPPARGVYFTHPKMVARLLNHENDERKA